MKEKIKIEVTFELEYDKGDKKAREEGIKDALTNASSTTTYGSCFVKPLSAKLIKKPVIKKKRIPVVYLSDVDLGFQ